MRTLSSNSRGLSALGISGEDKEKQQHFCYCPSPFYSTACVGSLLSVALLAASLVWSEFWRLLRLHGLIFRTISVDKPANALYYHSVEMIHLMLDYLCIKPAEGLLFLLESFVEIFDRDSSVSFCGTHSRERQAAFLYLVERL